MTEPTWDSDPTRRPPDRPTLEAGGTPLSARRVLLPRVKERDRIALALESSGAEVLRAAMTRTITGEAADLEATARRIVTGEAAWLVLTSARTVEALAPFLLAEAGIVSMTGGPGRHGLPTTSVGEPDAAPLPDRAALTAQHRTCQAQRNPGGRRRLVPVPSSVRVAVVGPSTARAWAELTGASADLVARGSATAFLEEPALAGGPAPAPYACRGTDPGAGSGGAPHGAPPDPRTPSDPRAFAVTPRSPARPESTRRVLLPASALADPALADGLRRTGWEVEQVAAYTTVTADAYDLPSGLARTWGAGGVDAVVLTAPSTTRAVLTLLGPPPSPTRLVAIGATTAAAAREMGLWVAATASSPTPESVLRAAIDAVQTSANSASLSQEPPP